MHVFVKGIRNKFSDGESGENRLIEGMMREILCVCVCVCVCMMCVCVGMMCV